MNVYTNFSTATVAALTSGLTALGWTPLAVRKGVWAPRTLLEFDRYLVFVAPPSSNPWSERVIASREIAYTLTAQIYLLVKNYNEEQSVYGDTAPNLGVFQMISDVKAVLRDTDLGGLIDRTYRETSGGSGFDAGAGSGFSTGDHAFVNRAVLTYTVQAKGFCF